MLFSRLARFVAPAIAVAGIAGSVAGVVMNHNTTSDLHRTHSTLVKTRSTLAETGRELSAAKIHEDQLNGYLHTAQDQTAAAQADADAAKAEISVNKKTIENLRQCATGALELSHQLIYQDYSAAISQMDVIDGPCNAGAEGLDASTDSGTSA